MTNNLLLPPGFESLEPLIAEWVLPDSVARSDKRQASTIEELRRFYDAMLPHAENALAYLRTFSLGAMPPECETLLKLLLSLAEIGPAIEWYNSPQVYDGFDVTRVRYVAYISDTGRQER